VPSPEFAHAGGDPEVLDRLMRMRAVLHALTGELASVRRQLRKAEAELVALKSQRGDS